MFDKECTGDLDAVIEYLDTIEGSNDNWIKGTKGAFKICAKVFAEGSSYGIGNGRISKIQVAVNPSPHWGPEYTLMNYDRGWDVRPSDDETTEFINGLLTAFGDEILDEDDLIYYELFGYITDEDFEQGNREPLGCFTYKDDAEESAQWYLQEEQYAVMKVISSDDEEIEITQREKTT